MAACLGTPLLNLLVGIGLGGMLGILTVPGREDGIHIMVRTLSFGKVRVNTFVLAKDKQSSCQYGQLFTTIYK